MAEWQAREWKRNLILFILTIEGRRKEQMNSMAYSTEHRNVDIKWFVECVTEENTYSIS